MATVTSRAMNSTIDGYSSFPRGSAGEILHWSPFGRRPKFRSPVRAAHMHRGHISLHRFLVTCFAYVLSNPLDAAALQQNAAPVYAPRSFVPMIEPRETDSSAKLIASGGIGFDVRSRVNFNPETSSCYSPRLASMLLHWPR